MGSGKSGTPCLRMHAEIATRCCFCCSDACAGGPPPGNTFLQVACAALTAGDEGLTPVPAMSMPPCAVGSGKPGTPRLRMHSEEARNDPAIDEARSLGPDEPQPAMATTHIPAISETGRRWRRSRVEVVVGIICARRGARVV